jgi:hypothetical protein
MSAEHSTRDAAEMDRRGGGNVRLMHHARAPIALVLGLLVTGGCLASKSSLEDGGQPLVDGETGDSAGTAGTTTDGPGASSAGGSGSVGTTAADEDATEADDGAGLKLDVGVPAGCVGIDLDGCFAAAIAACDEGGGWLVDESCVAAVVACFPLGTSLLAPRDITDACSAELAGECLSDDLPGCGLSFCRCTVGSYPFDWNNCWHLTTTACAAGSASDCEAVVQSCYPDVTVAEFEACYTQVTQADLGYGCNCPNCGFHEECEAELATCLAA